MSVESKILIVEDDRIYALKVRMNLEQYFDKKNIKYCSSAKGAFPVLETWKPNVILIDVILETKNAGVSLARRANELKIPIIFMTAFKGEDIFKMALGVKPTSYLQKPFSAINLKRAIELAVQQDADDHTKKIKTKKTVDYLFLKRNHGVKDKVFKREIFIIEAFGNYCHLHTANHRYTVRLAIKDYNAFLQSERFIRIHRHYVVNTDYIEHISTKENLIQVNGQKYPLGRKYKTGLIQKI